MQHADEEQNQINNDQPKQPSIIEEEPAHEFYTRLCGISATKIACKTQQCLSTIKAAASASSSLDASFAIVPFDVYEDENETDKDNPEGKEESSFSKHYKKALLRPPPNMSELTLDKSNKGFTMLAKMGWNEEDGGLGKNRQGTMVPVKTRSKPNQCGLGRTKASVDNQARITHTDEHIRRSNPKDKSIAQQAEAMVAKMVRRSKAREQANRDKRREKLARMILRMDVSAEYEELYWKLHS